MNPGWRQSKARCPAYEASTTRAITCTCHGETVTGFKIRGAAPADVAEWFRRKCATNYESCPVWKTIRGIERE